MRGASLGRLLSGVGILWATGGCGVSVVGHWSLVEAVPSREVFCLDDATFRQDGTYEATLTLDGKTARQSGTYNFNGFSLTLRPDGGGRRKYDAIEQFGRLEIQDGGRRAVLKKDRGHGGG